MTALHLDFETFSTLDLKKVGVENYLRDPSTEVTVVGWAFDDEPAQSRTYPNCSLPDEVFAHIRKGGIIKAWNARFEWSVLTLAYGLPVDHGQMDCVMERALAWGLPGSLQEAGDALGLSIIKDKAARSLMLEMSKPSRGGALLYKSDPAKLDALANYCRRDVEAERALDKVVPLLSTFEKEISVLSAMSNQVGVLVDMAAVDALRAAAGYEKAALDAECAVLTMGEVDSPGTQSARLVNWIFTRMGRRALANTTKEAIAEALATVAWPDDVRRVLEIRQLAAKSSLAKLEAMKLWASSHDGRARNMFQFYGAGRTGRWAGRGPQPQNLPRPDKGLNQDAVIGVAMAEPSGLGLFYGAPLKAISGSLRGCLVAKPDHVLVSIDLSQIEARVLAWMAGQDNVVRQFREHDRGVGEDVYVLAARALGSRDRQLGKAAVLSLGYSAGAEKFMSMAAAYGVTLNLIEAQAVVDAWRNGNPSIKYFWWGMQRAALGAIGVKTAQWDQWGRGTLGGMTMAGANDVIKMKVVGPALAVRKPGGGKLWYHNPRGVESGIDQAFEFDGPGRNSGIWQAIRGYGGFLVENIVQATARDIVAEAVKRSSILPIMSVHDELVWEVPAEGAEATAAKLQKEMEVVPDWAKGPKGLPVASEIKISRRFSK